MASCRNCCHVGAVSRRLPRQGWRMPRIVCDVHEIRSGVPAHLAGLGADVEIRALERGDYVVAVNGLVERKTIPDLHSSILKGRFWAQMGKIRLARRPYLVLEGRTLYSGPVPDEAVRGLCLAVVDLGVTIVRTENTSDTAAWLIEIAAGGAPIRDRPVFAQRPQIDGERTRGNGARRRLWRLDRNSPVAARALRNATRRRSGDPRRSPRGHRNRRQESRSNLCLIPRAAAAHQVQLAIPSKRNGERRAT